MIAETTEVVIEEACDGEEALAAIRLFTPDLVVLDLHLPKRNGLSVLEALQAAPSRPLVAIFTNDATAHHRREAARLGAEYFFDKSTEFESVLTLIDELASSDSERRDVRPAK